MRKPIFDAIKTARGGKGWETDEIASLDALLDKLGVPQGAKRQLTNPVAFFDAVRASFGPLSQSQVDGFNAMLKGMGEASWSTAWTAYGLATAWHETAQRMQPVREGLDVSDAWRKTNLRYYPWYGRGHVQTTWERNYKRVDDELGLGGKLVANADLMLTNEVSVPTLVKGMANGWFTGKRLSDYLPDERGTIQQFTAARKIINGTDRDAKIAGEAQRFQAALQAGGWS